MHSHLPESTFACQNPLNGFQLNRFTNTLLPENFSPELSLKKVCTAKNRQFSEVTDNRFGIDGDKFTSCVGANSQG